MKFSSSVLKNTAIAKLAEYVAKNEKTTGVFTIGDELEFNPFMRLSDPQVMAATGLQEPDQVMDKLRELKNKGWAG